MHNKSTSTKTTKQSINLSVNRDLLRAAKELDINLSKRFEAVLEEDVRKARALEWERKNEKFIKDHNARIERDGVFGEKWRKF